MPIILRSSFVHPSFILRSSFDWGLEDDYCNFGESLREILFFGCRLCRHGDVLGVGHMVVAHGVVGEIDAVEGLYEGLKGLLSAVGL